MVTGLAAETDYRKVLKKELDARLARQPKYSLRAFAADLGLAPSRLSEIMSGKQGLSRQAAQRIAGVMQLSDSDAATFCDLVESQHARGQVTRDLARVRLEKHRIENEFHTLSLDAFQVVADWYHFAIIQLSSLGDNKSAAGWIAQALGITKTDAARAVARLKRLGLIRETNGRLQPVKEYLATTDGIPSAAIRKFHRQVLLRAIEALESQDVAERSYSSVFVAMDRARLEEAKRWIRNFKRRFMVKAEAAGEKDSVYCLAVQFFDLTHALRRKG